MFKWVTLSLIVLTLCFSGFASAEKPNIVLIFADDMGYGCAGSYGDTGLVPTPNIDRLAAEGVRFTDGYVTGPACAPSRYGLLMGAYQQRIGVQGTWDAYVNLQDGKPRDTPENNRVPSTHKMVHQTLSGAGYRSAVVGKYNLSSYPKTTFDEGHSVMMFAGDYFPDETGYYGGVGYMLAPGTYKRILWGPERPGDEYLTDRLGRQSVEFMEREHERGRPFFLYLAFNAPHSPMQAKKEDRKVVEHLETEATKMYGAMLHSMDENIGKVLDALDRMGIADNTIVAFASDNGPSFAYRVDWPENWPRELLGSAGPLRGHKGMFTEGGIRVPYIIRWPDGLQAGQVYERPVSTMDLYPTFCAAAGIPIPETTKLDGVNLLPYLRGEVEGDPHDVLYWSIRNRGAVRQGDWKLYVDGKPQLYNLANDIGETTDLSKQHPEITRELNQKFQAFLEMQPPKLYKGKTPFD
ncbi:sulfatase family protein [Algisphaera agarilytica]|uniref:Arylsulfatase A-like enzyme n=1 Tax=Algisphaera agarilytica TaxID=1385975 RepID=A0A7X0H837_9BACT|nr:sulfatase-like hydrolase/transferase [Algisphaera agarilytica]MBB6431003.1 arylsulfatase A-like enzyme [Algisphaera agarilytica]